MKIMVFCLSIFISIATYSQNLSGIVSYTNMNSGIKLPDFGATIYLVGENKIRSIDKIKKSIDSLNSIIFYKKMIFKYAEIYEEAKNVGRPERDLLDIYSNIWQMDSILKNKYGIKHSNDIDSLDERVYSNVFQIRHNYSAISKVNSVGTYEIKVTPGIYLAVIVSNNYIQPLRINDRAMTAKIVYLKGGKDFSVEFDKLISAPLNDYK